MKIKMIPAGAALATLAGLLVAIAAPPAPAAPLPAAPDSPLDRAVAAADRAAASGLDALAKGVSEEYQRRLVTPWVNGLYSIGYERTYRGLPVVGGDAVVLADGDGRVRAIQAGWGAGLAPTPVPGVSAAAAEAISRAQLARVDTVESRRLTVLIQAETPRLAWETVVAGRSSTGESRLHVFVDAGTGAVLSTRDDVKHGTGTGRWNGPNPLAISTTYASGSYSMRDPGRPNLSCADYSTGTVFSGSDDSWGNGSGTSKETGCVDAMFDAGREWDMLRDWLGRNGHDGNGGSFQVQIGMNDVNATWNGSKVSIGHNNANEWISSMDVVAHEYGHAIDQYTPGGSSGNELGEFVSDVFGALTEAYANEPSPYDTPDYLVGEMINLVGNGPIRNMYDPAALGDPNCYSSSIPSTETHAAAGPGNHWFYLLAEGSNPGGGNPTSPTCNGSSLTGVGVQTAGKIFYGGMLLKTSSMTYTKFRTATLTSAKNLDASCTLFVKTKAAWDAVSLPAQAGDPTCTPSGNDFSLSVSPTSGNVQPGGSVTATVSTATTSGSAQTVSLSATGAPSGVTVSFSPSSVQSGSSATMTVATSSSAAPGSYSITVTGTGSTSHTVQYALTIGSTPPGGAPDIDVANVQAHLAQLDTIAAQNGGTRRAGTSGYTASLNYIKGKLQAAGYTLTEQYCSTCTYPSNNLIADWPGGPADQVVMFGAHLDSVSAGPGINDNGSGSATLLEVALALAQRNPSLTKHVRFAWWTDEEQGLNGSGYYVNSLSSTQRGYIKGYYNFDMVASPNGGYFINRITSTTAAPLKEYWDSLTLQPEENTEGQGRSDDASFANAGIATSGYATGASATKTSAQASKWGGTAGAAYDSCYHRSCDTSSNINATELNRSADGVSYALWKLAVGSSTGCTPGQLVGNGGFETGTAPWTVSAGVIDSSSSYPAHGGTYKAWLDGYGSSHTDSATQSITIPSGCTSYTLSFYLRVDTDETTTSTAYDKLTVQLGSSTLATYSNLNASTGYLLKSINVAGYAGQTVTLKFTGTEDSSLQTSFLLDDVALQVS